MKTKYIEVVPITSLKQLPSGIFTWDVELLIDRIDAALAKYKDLPPRNVAVVKLLARFYAQKSFAMDRFLSICTDNEVFPATTPYLLGLLNHPLILRQVTDAQSIEAYEPGGLMVDHQKQKQLCLRGNHGVFKLGISTYMGNGKVNSTGYDNASGIKLLTFDQLEVPTEKVLQEGVADALKN